MLLRVASYNIHAGTDADSKPSLNQIITTLRETNADVVLLQEIDRLLPRSGFLDQFAVIADRLGYDHKGFYGRLCFGPCAFGNAVLSRRPVERWQRLPLPSRGGEPRAAVGAFLEDGTTVWCTHLGLRQDWRASQISALANVIRCSDAPTIVGGDFNALRSDPEMEGLRADSRLDDFGEEEPTIPVVGPYRRIDHLMARGFTRLSAGTREDRGSDHRLIWADFETTPLAAANP